MSTDRSDRPATPPVAPLDRPLWKAPEVTEISILAMTASNIDMGGNDGTPSYTKLS